MAAASSRAASHVVVMAEGLTSAVRAREVTRAFVSFARARALFRGVSLSRERARARDLRRRCARERVFERGVSIDRSRDGGGAREGVGTMGAMARMWLMFPR